MDVPGWNIGSATLAAPGALATALSDAGPLPIVYPLFMTDGWFIQTLLPKRIGAHPVDILAPLGTEAALPDLVSSWLQSELSQAGWQSSETTLVIASHGSGRSQNSARDTNRFAQALTSRITFADTRTGYIEEAPYLSDAAKHAGHQSICLPFFAASGEHVQEDIPQALDQAEFTGLRLASIGTHPGIPALIANSLRNRTRQKVSA